MVYDRKVLIIDDEPMMRESVAAYLTTKGYCALTADNGKDAMDILANETVSFVILDLMLPEMPGEEICRRIREISQVPIIMVTAKTQEESILNGLRIGADDYMTKPFSVKQLYARMEAILRRIGDHTDSVQQMLFGNDDLAIDLAHNEVRKSGIPVSLTPSEWKILAVMVRHPKKVFTREELIEVVFGDDFDSFDRVIDTHIKNLRKKIETNSKNPEYIKTVHGFGYKFGGGETR